ncbi:MAG: hypothetical protein IJ410_08230 [Oscillospiraceae bacterium]|nr:hypothetical protein [Oscillospiraceae bacterium]
MFLIFSILAASIDGFISGILIGGIGVKFGYREFFKSLAVIFGCCLAAACTGNILQMTAFGKYINITGAAVMIFLAWSALTEEKSGGDHSSIYAVSVSVATDAAIVCIYLSAAGYSIMQVSVLSALLHSVLMAAGAFLSGKVIKDRRQLYTRYISAVIFLAMAVYKLAEI